MACTVGSWTAGQCVQAHHLGTSILDGEQKNGEEETEQSLLESLGVFREFREHNFRWQKAKDVLCVFQRVREKDHPFSLVILINCDVIQIWNILLLHYLLAGFVVSCSLQPIKIKHWKKDFLTTHHLMTVIRGKSAWYCVLQEKWLKKLDICTLRVRTIILCLMPKFRFACIMKLIMVKLCLMCEMDTHS